MYNKNDEAMTKEEVAKKLQLLIYKKNLFTRSQTSDSNYIINRKVVKGIYFNTMNPCVYASDKESRDFFNNLSKKGVIMSCTDVLKRFREYRSRYDVDVACMSGKMMKFSELSGVAIYLKDEEE